jgi:hypothetical protein
MIGKILSYFQDKLFLWCLSNKDSPLVEILDYGFCDHMMLEENKFRFARLITMQKVLYF